MKKQMKEMLRLCKAIAKNDADNNARWKNLQLVPEAYEKLVALPLDFDEEVNAANRVDLIGHFADCISELDIPRFSLKMREYQLSIYDQAEGCETRRQDIEKDIERLKDYLNPLVSVNAFCRKYNRHLRFDNVERSPEWEKVIYEVEKEVDEELKGEPRGMGFCYSYWSAKKAALARHGIEWASPSATNPGVIFD